MEKGEKLKTEKEYKVSIKTERLMGWDINLSDEGLVTVPRGESFEFDLTNPEHMHVVLSEIRLINDPRKINRCLRLIPGGAGVKESQYYNLSEVIEYTQDVPSELFKIMPNINNWLTKNERKLVMDICPEYGLKKTYPKP